MHEIRFGEQTAQLHQGGSAKDIQWVELAVGESRRYRITYGGWMNWPWRKKAITWTRPRKPYQFASFFAPRTSLKMFYVQMEFELDASERERTFQLLPERSSAGEASEANPKRSPHDFNPARTASPAGASGASSTENQTRIIR